VNDLSTVNLGIWFQFVHFQIGKYNSLPNRKISAFDWASRSVHALRVRQALWRRM